jgi:hypothetical protein
VLAVLTGCTGTCFPAFFEFKYGAPQGEKRGFGCLVPELLLDSVQKRIPLRWREETEPGAQLGIEEGHSHLWHQVGEGGLEGDEGFERFTGAAVDGPDEEVEMVG